MTAPDRDAPALDLVPSSELPAERLARFLAEPDVPGRFRRSQGAAYYGWLLEGGPSGPAVSWCAVDGERVVGSLSAALREIRVQGETVLAAKLEEMKTDPAYRGRGILRRVFERVRSDAIARGVRLLLGGPTSPMSFPIFVERLGFEAPFAIRTWVRPLALPRLARVRGVLHEEDAIPEGAAALGAAARREAPIGVCREPAYLRWRYERHPDPYRVFSLRRGRALRALAVCKETRQKGLRIVNVVELLGEDAGARLALLDALAPRLRPEGRGGLLALWPPRGDAALAHGRRGFLPYPAATRFVLRAEPELAERAGAALRTRSAWWLSMGDFLDV